MSVPSEVNTCPFDPTVKAAGSPEESPIIILPLARPAILAKVTALSFIFAVSTALSAKCTTVIIFCAISLAVTAFSAILILVTALSAINKVTIVLVAISLAVILFSAIKVEVTALIAGKVSIGLFPIYAILCLLHY